MQTYSNKESKVRQGNHKMIRVPWSYTPDHFLRNRGHFCWIEIPSLAAKLD